jgi:ribose transport system ATP-binding protein
VITVIKDGAVTGTLNADEATADQVINMMIGRQLTAMFPKRHAKVGEEIFRVEGLNRGRKVRDVSFSVRAGEVLGIAGLVGSGRTETVRAIFGADAKDSGQVVLENRPLRIRSPRAAVKSGIALLPEDRKEQGAILSMSIRKNVTMPSLSRVTTALGIVRQTREKRITQNLIDRLAIKTNSTETAVTDLSGGNQQKVVLAKWLGTECKLLILDEPTRGVDVGAKVEIYNIINELAESGLGIVVISSEMIELIGMCDRVMVMREGRIRGILEKEDLSEENIMRLAIIEN